MSSPKASGISHQETRSPKSHVPSPVAKPRRRGLAAVGFAGLIAGWVLLSYLATPLVVPWPWVVAREFIMLLPDTLIPHLLVSLARVTAATVISILTAVPLGIWLGTNLTADAVLSPLAYVLFPIPKVALLPVLMILLGLGERSKLALMLLILFFQTLVATRDAVRGIERPYLYSIATLHPTLWARWRYLYIPYALPKILAALRIGVGTALAVLFFAENYGTRYGIGYYIMDRWMRFRYAEMFAGIIALSILGLGLFALVDWLEKRLCPWRTES